MSGHYELARSRLAAKASSRLLRLCLPFYSQECTNVGSLMTIGQHTECIIGGRIAVSQDNHLYQRTPNPTLREAAPS